MAKCIVLQILIYYMNQLKRKRIESLDLLKGLVMVLMALDHTRDYFHVDAFFFDPTDPMQTNAGLFITRWITHYCAPAFCFLAGISAFLVGQNKTKKEGSVFLVKRGVWLVFIELSVVNFGWFFDIYFSTIALMVIWSLGISMIILAGLIHLPMKVILGGSLMVIFGHNFLDVFDSNQNLMWSIFHKFNFFSLDNGKTLVIGYPIIPWFAVMSLGYYFGKFYQSSVLPRKRKVWFNWIGVSAIGSFFILRFLNEYGNYSFWERYETHSASLFSFFNPSKYPPSLMYLLMTLGPVFLILANSENAKGKVVHFFAVFGKVPFFYYILHLFVIHACALVAAQLTGYGWENMIIYDFVTLMPSLKGYGFSLPWVYLIWGSIITLLYPVCLQFSKYKANNKDKKWLSYF
jgi:uncharacterized membrane protein